MAGRDGGPEGGAGAAPAALCDQHVHPEDGPYAPGTYTLEWFGRYLEVGRARGVGPIGLVEHAYRFREAAGLLEGAWAEARCRYTLDQYDAHRRQIAEAGLGPFRFGLEVDHVPGKGPAIGRFLASRPWDLVLGSVHWLGDMAIDGDPDGWGGRSADAVWDGYVEAVEDLCRSGLYDVLTHPDLPKLWGHRPRRPLGPRYDRLTAAVAAAGMALEVNTNGLNRPVGEIYPAPDLLARAHEAGVPITLASDAHRPERVGEAFDRAVRLARAAGYDRYVSLVGRIPEALPLRPPPAQA